MPKAFRHYRVLHDQLEQFIESETKAAILAGLDNITDSSSPAAKAAWALEVTRRMDAILDVQTCISVREGCACVLSNKNSIYARTFRRLRKQYPDDRRYIEEAINYLNHTQPLKRCGEVSFDGHTIHSVIGCGACGCSVLRDGLSQPISMTWCHCCKGSLLSVYRYLFTDRSCEMEIVSTVATGGDECRFVTRFQVK